MKRKRLDGATISVLVLSLSIILISVIAALVSTAKGDSRKDSPPPALTFPSVSDVPKRDEIIVAYSDKTDEQTYEKDGIELIFSFVSYPYIEGGNDEATAKINDAIASFVNERVTIKSYEKTNAEDSYNRSQDEPTGFIEFEFITRAESVCVKNGYISIMFRRVRTVSISEPKEDITALCFDLMSGDKVDISSFMNVDTVSATSFVLDVFTQHIKINPKQYYNDALETLPDIVDISQFYLTDDGLILFFNPDIITPSVMGICKFTVPYDKIGY